MPSRSRAATAAAFFAQGLVFISLTTRLPDFKDRWDLSELDLSLLLLMMVLLAGVGSVAAERLAARRDSALAAAGRPVARRGRGGGPGHRAGRPASSSAAWRRTASRWA